ncbi:MAG: hypothetical protein WCK63_12020 [Betaproteobacteria bacterium]
MIVAFDLFSAMTNSRASGSRILGEFAVSRGWEHTGDALYNH